jgi:hypothetical protein
VLVLTRYCLHGKKQNLCKGLLASIIIRTRKERSGRKGFIVVVVVVVVWRRKEEVNFPKLPPFFD